MGELKKVIYNCRQATFLVEKRELAPLTFREHVKLRIHLIGCDACQRYLKQSRMINELLKHILRREKKNRPQLDDTFRTMLQDRIDDHLRRD